MVRSSVLRQPAVPGRGAHPTDFPNAAVDRNESGRLLAVGTSVEAFDQGTDEDRSGNGGVGEELGVAAALIFGDELVPADSLGVGVA